MAIIKMIVGVIKMSAYSHGVQSLSQQAPAASVRSSISCLHENLPEELSQTLLAQL